MDDLAVLHPALQTCLQHLKPAVAQAQADLGAPSSPPPAALLSTVLLPPPPPKVPRSRQQGPYKTTCEPCNWVYGVLLCLLLQRRS